MALASTETAYGTVARGFHWLTALLILTAIPLGVIANRLPIAEDTIQQKILLFSLHKTLGITIFFIALGRIGWAIAQPRPAAIHPERRLETILAAATHWTLYIALVLVPLSGWFHHAATTGFAPIIWPFGQSLPFIPKDAQLAELFSATHWVFTKLLVAAILLHMAGALKHALIDRDGTLPRMAVGRPAGTAATTRPSRRPALAALALWVAAIGLGAALGVQRFEAVDAGPVALPQPGWVVEDGTVSITIRQIDASITGSFRDWDAVIDFDPDADGEIKGSIDATVDIGSLSLGSITDQALGPDFFDVARFPAARFSGPISEDPRGDGYVALGLVSIKDSDWPLELPFAIQLDETGATAVAQFTLDRRDFGIGAGIDDAASLGFEVTVDIALSAVRP